MSRDLCAALLSVVLQFPAHGAKPLDVDSVYDTSLVIRFLARRLQRG